MALIYCDIEKISGVNLIIFGDVLGFALGIEAKILFAPIAKRLQRKARPNARMCIL